MKRTLSTLEWERLLRELRASGTAVPNPELLLRRLVRDGQVERLREDQEEGAKDAWEAFVEVAEEEAGYQRELQGNNPNAGGAGHQWKRDVPVAVGEKDERAAAICSELLAREAADDPVVVGFRERELGGEMLTPDEAGEYLWNAYRCALLAEMPPDEADRIILERKRRAHSNGREALILVDDLLRGGPHQFLLDHPEREATLGDLAAYLSWRYPWTSEHAAWFALTGEPPHVEAVGLELGADHTWTFTVHPWASKEALIAAYRVMWTPWIGDCRPPTDEALDLLEFVIARPGESWRTLREVWNAQYPGRFFTTYSGLRRAYNRARQKLAPRRL